MIFKDTFLKTIFKDTFQRHLSKTLFKNTFQRHFLKTFFKDTFQRHFSKTLFENIFQRHFSMTATMTMRICSGIVMDFPSQVLKNFHGKTKKLLRNFQRGKLLGVV